MNNVAETFREIVLKEADKFLCSLDLTGEAEYSLIIYKKILIGLEFYKSLTFPNISNEILKFGDVLSAFAECEKKELNS